MDEAVVAEADVLLVEGTSLQVYPAAGLIFEAPWKRPPDRGQPGRSRAGERSSVRDHHQARDGGCAGNRGGTVGFQSPGMTSQ
jgi:hypothetical protein